MANDFLGGPFGLVVLGCGHGAGAESTEVKKAGDPCGLGGGHDMSGAVLMDAVKSLGTVGLNDADAVNDGLGSAEGFAERCGVGDVGGEELDSCGQGVRGGGAGESAHGESLGEEGATNFSPDKAGTTCYDNHMASMLEEIVIYTEGHTEFMPLAQPLEKVAAERGWRDGLLHIVIPHTTAAVTIQEGADPDVRHDLAVALERAVPWENRDYRHGEGNSAAHLKAAMLGNHLAWPIEKGKLRLGTWQMIYFAEFDGPRSRRAWVGFHPLSVGPQSKIS